MLLETLSFKVKPEVHGRVER